MNDRNETPFLSLAILAYNEAETVERAARLCSHVLETCGRSYELVLVNDGSTDGTGEIMEGLVKQLPHCRTIHHPLNLGIGMGIRTCYFQTIGQWATWFPADLQADPGELSRLLKYLPDCDVLVTYRDARRRREGWFRKLISSVDRLLVRLLFGVALRDLHWVRFFHRSVLERMSLSACSPFVDTEMIVCARKMGARLAEAPLDDRPRTSGTAKGATLSNLVRAVNELGTLYLRGVRLISTERADTSWLPRAEASGTDGFAQRR